MPYFLQLQKLYEVGGIANIVDHWSLGVEKSVPNDPQVSDRVGRDKGDSYCRNLNGFNEFIASYNQ